MIIMVIYIFILLLYNNKNHDIYITLPSKLFTLPPLFIYSSITFNFSLSNLEYFTLSQSSSISDFVFDLILFVIFVKYSSLSLSSLYTICTLQHNDDDDDDKNIVVNIWIWIWIWICMHI